MDASVAAGGVVAAPHLPPPPPAAAPVEVTAPETAVESGNAKGSRTPFDHALFQGQGAKKGILKRMATEEIQAVQDELGVRARAAAEEVVASRAEEEPTPLVEFATPPPVQIPLTEPVQAVPVDASRLGIDPVETLVVEPPPDSLVAVDVTEFVQAAGIAAEES